MITKEAVLRHIELNPGCRRRDLPGWGADRLKGMDILHQLEAEGKIYSVDYRDPAQMEYCYKYYAVEGN